MPGNPHLPSLLRNLTSTSNRPTAAISLDSPSTSASSPLDDDNSSRGRSSNASIARRPEFEAERGRKYKSDSPTSTSRASSSRRQLGSSAASHQRDANSRGSRTRFRSSSGSSLEGLTARLHGARRGRENSTQPGSSPPNVTDRCQETTEISDSRECSGKNHSRDPLRPSDELCAVPTISLQTDEVISHHGSTQVVAPDVSEPPLPLAVPSSSESPAFSTQTSEPDYPPPPPPRIRVNYEQRNDDKGPTAKTFASALSTPDMSDEETESSSSSSENENDEANSPTGSSSFVSRADAHPDPRKLLRDQLAKAETEGGGRSGAADDQHERNARYAKRDVVQRGASGYSQRSSTGPTTEVYALKKVYQRRRYFILSTAGKLVYTSDSDEDMASGLAGVMQAIVSIFADEGDKIRCVAVGNARIMFLLKSPLYLVVSSSWGEPESVLRTHLDYLYLQVLSVVTLTQLQSIFSRRSNFDLRRMMEGTEPFFHSLVNTMQTSIPILTSSLEVYRLDPNVRSEIARILDPGREVTRKLDLLYVLLLAHGRLVTLLRPKKHSIHPTDLHLLLSTIYSSSLRANTASSNRDCDPQNDDKGDYYQMAQEEQQTERRTSPLTEPGLESWLPICLPRFNAKGFLHAYVSFLNQPTLASAKPLVNEGIEGGIGLILLSADREGFPSVKEAAEGIKERLLSARSSPGDLLAAAGSDGKSKNRMGGKAAGGLVHELEKARILQEYSLVELAIPGLRHFIYKSRALVQSTRPAWEGDYLKASDRYRLITLYQHVSDVLHPRPAQSGSAARKPAQVQYLRTEREAVLGWSTPSFELYVTTSPSLPHSAVVSAARSVSKWVEKEEHNLFLTSSPSF